MPALTTIIAAAGLATGAFGAYKQYEGQTATIKAEQDAEHTRQAAMNFDATRRQRQLLREQQTAQGQAVSAASNQGGIAGSGLQGGLSQIAGQTNLGIANNEAARGFGNREFAANQAIFSARGETALGEGLTSLGGGMVKNAGGLSDFGNSVYKYLS